MCVSLKAILNYLFLIFSKSGLTTPRIDDSQRFEAVDDVYFNGFFKIKNYPFEETVLMHRETAHPTIFNKPDNSVFVNIELAMAADKKVKIFERVITNKKLFFLQNKYLDSFSNIVMLPYPYPVTHKRTIMCLCKDEEMVDHMRSLDVDLALGPEFLPLLEVSFKFDQILHRLIL